MMLLIIQDGRLRSLNLALQLSNSTLFQVNIRLHFANLILFKLH